MCITELALNQTNSSEMYIELDPDLVLNLPLSWVRVLKFLGQY